jgi:hypothetical protein
MTCRPTKNVFASDEPLSFICELTNNTAKNVVVGWETAAQFTHFTLVSATSISPPPMIVYDSVTGRYISDARSCQVQSVSASSRPQTEQGFPVTTLTLTANETASFRLRTPAVATPCRFRGRMIFDPVPVDGGGMACSDDFDWRNRYVYSPVFEFTVVHDDKSPKPAQPNATRDCAGRGP